MDRFPHGRDFVFRKQNWRGLGIPLVKISENTSPANMFSIECSGRKIEVIYEVIYTRFSSDGAWWRDEKLFDGD